ncbi:MAG: recombinase family protein, partial [bacterium]|nr:recombinase family protein [bacterium]
MRKVTKIAENRPISTKREKLRTAAYARVSTDSDEQLISLQAQKRHYEAYIKANSDWEFAGLYFDEGISGTKKGKRTELLRLLKDCENRKVDFIVTKSISRLARNTTDCLEIVRRLTELNIYIYFEKENINTQSMDNELMLTILSSLAEGESVSISQNNKWSVTNRFKNGSYKLGCPPYGYDLADGKLTPNSEQALIVRRIFAEVLSGKGASMVAAGLNAESIKSQKGIRWTATTIRGILVNEKYVGDVLFQKTYSDDNFLRHINNGEKDQYYLKEHHEAIISHADFTAAASILAQFGKEKGISKGATKYQNRYVFSSRIRCGECQSPFKRRMHKAGTGNYVAWCCSKHLKSVKECSMLFIRDEQIKQAFVTLINRLHSGRSYILKPLIQDLKSLEHSGVWTKVQEVESKIEENAERR